MHHACDRGEHEVDTFRAPRLRYLILTDFTLPTQSLQLIPGAGLVTLTLESVDPSAEFNPENLLEQLSLMHHLQLFAIDLTFPFPDNGGNGWLITIHVTLPNLRSFAFRGQRAYLEAFLPHIATPFLESLYISLHNELTLSGAHVQPYIIPGENFTGKVTSAVLQFNVWVCRVVLYPDVGVWMYSWCLQLNYRNFGWQVAIAAQVLDVIRPVLSEVVHLTLEFQEGSATTQLARLLNNPDSEDWSKVLRAFGNVKTLSMHNGLVGEVSRSLLSDGGEYSVDL